MENRTYRYYTGKPLYPFGYGLTYGDAVITKLNADRENAYVTVENRGAATEEVIQLYIKDEKSVFAPTNPVLCGFQRIAMEAGECKQIYIPIDPYALTVVNGDGERISGSGNWKLYAGFGQPDERTAELTGKQAVCVELK